MLITTGYNFEGYVITSYIDVISESVVLGTGFASSFSASLADITGGKSPGYANKLQSGKQQALHNLQKQAERVGANAIIGIDIDYTTFTGDIMGIIANGTAVRIEPIKEKNDKIEMAFPARLINAHISFNVCSLNIMQHLATNIIMGNLTIHNYDTDNIVTAVIADIELEELFGKTRVLKDIIFTHQMTSKEILYTTNYATLNNEEIQLNLLRKVFVNVKKYILNDDEKVNYIDENENKKNIEDPLEELKKSQSIHGKDAVCGLNVDEKQWRCYCGAKNDTDSEQCFRCGRKIDFFKRKSYSSDTNNSLVEILKVLESKDNVQEMWEYVEKINVPEFEPLQKLIEKQALIEKYYGNRKEDTLKKVHQMFD